MFVPTKDNIAKLIQELIPYNSFDINRIKYSYMSILNSNSILFDNDNKYFLNVQLIECSHLLCTIFETPNDFMNEYLYSTQTQLLHDRIVALKHLFSENIRNFIESGAYYIAIARMDLYFTDINFGHRDNNDLASSKKRDAFLCDYLSRYLSRLNQDVLVGLSNFHMSELSSMTIRERYISEIKYLLSQKKYNVVMAIIDNHVKDPEYRVYIQSLYRKTQDLFFDLDNKDIENEIKQTIFILLSDLPLVDVLF